MAEEAGQTQGDATQGQEGAAADGQQTTQGETTEQKTARERDEAGKFKAPSPPAWKDYIAGIQDEGARKLGERYESAEEALKGHAEAVKMARTRDGFVKVPGKDATDEDRAAFRKAMGVPDGPESYGIALPEEMTKADPGAVDRLGAFLKMAHGFNIPREAATAIVNWHNEQNRTSLQQFADAERKDRETADASLKEAWGADYSTNRELAARAALWAAGDELTDHMTKLGLDVSDPSALIEGVRLSSPALLTRMMAKIGRFMAPEVPQIAQPMASIESDYEATEREYNERAARGTHNDPEFQKRWAEVNRRRYSNAA